MTELTDVQLLALMHSGPLLDKIAPLLNHEQQAMWLDLQRRAGDAYTSGEWHTPSGDRFTCPMCSARPTRAEAQAAFGEAYIALDEQKAELRKVMDEMGLSPSSGSWVERVTENIKGWLR